MAAIKNDLSTGTNTNYSITSTNNVTNDGSSIGNYLILFDDVNSYLENINLTSNSNNTNSIWSTLNCTTNNGTTINSTICWTSNHTDLNSGDDINFIEYNYWALILVLFPIFTLFGNILVILSVYRERTLQTATNYFIVSLAFADLLVAGLVMPFAVYVLVNGTWALPSVVCDFYIAMDVTCSTSSIFNLVAISIDRYIAVTQPMKYARHKNNRRVWLTIALVWVISMAIGSPIVLGLNNTPDRVADACLFYNSDFIIYSSLSSFYIPCIIMIFLYFNIFKELRNRAKKSKAVRRPQTYEIKPGTVIENVASTRRLAETQLGGDNNQLGVNITPIPIDEQATNTGSGSADEDDDIVVLQDNNVILPEDVDDCHIISNDKSTEFILATVVEEAASISSVVATLASPAPLPDPNGNNDSGYAPSQPEIQCDIHSPSKRIIRSQSKRSNGATTTDTSDTELKPIRTISDQTTERDRTSNGSKKERKATTAARFTIYKVNKASKKKREKSSAKKERKATKTLAIVLGVFLICWVPFFTCNIMDAMCSKLGMDCQPGFAAFLLTTWLGYMNSFVNPVIYTIFNPEFRKAFKKLMHIGV